MKKFLSLISIIFILVISSFSIHGNIKAESNFTNEIYGVPFSVTLNGTLNEISVNFDISGLRKDINIVNSSIKLNQDQDLTDTSLIKVLGSQNDDILSVTSGSLKGAKTLTGLARFTKFDQTTNTVTFRLKVDNLDKEIKLSDITLILEYTVTDKIAPKIQSIQILEETNDTALITWETDEQTKSSVWYGKTSNYTKSVNSDTSSLVPDSNPPIYRYSVLIMNLSPGITYHFQVAAEDIAGNVTKSNDNTFITKLDIASIQVLGENDTVGLKKIEGIVGELFFEDNKYTFEVTWLKSEDSNIDGYILYRKVGEEDMIRYAEIESDKTKYIDTDIIEGKEYSYFIRSYRDEIVSPKSDQLQILAVKDNISNRANSQTNELIDVAKIISFVAALTMFALVCGYFIMKKLGKFVKEVFTMDKRKNLFRDPKFIQDEFEKSNKHKL
jgi:hypothetical protein